MGAFDQLSDDDYRVIRHEQRVSCACEQKKQQRLKIFCIEFKERKRGIAPQQVYTVVIAAESEAKAIDHFHKKYIPDVGLDIDKRTIKWGGSSIPAAIQEGDDCVASFMHFGKIED